MSWYGPFWVTEGLRGVVARFWGIQDPEEDSDMSTYLVWCPRCGLSVWVPTHRCLGPLEGALRPPSAYGTIGDMADHRIRLTDEDLSLIVAALRARAAMAGPLRRHRIERLADRLSEGRRGNPKWLLDDLGQTHEEDLVEDE